MKALAIALVVLCGCAGRTRGWAGYAMGVPPTQTTYDRLAAAATALGWTVRVDTGGADCPLSWDGGVLREAKSGRGPRAMLQVQPDATHTFEICELVVDGKPIWIQAHCATASDAQCD